jgi:hypothetical protein
MGVCVRAALLAILSALSAAAATFTVQGAHLVVTSNNLQVSFSGIDVVAVTNSLTSEQYLHNPSSVAQSNLQMTQFPSTTLAAGSWTVNSAGNSASLTLSDATRTISAVVTVDPSTQEVVVNLDGKSSQPGVERLVWGATGFDMTSGQFIVPAQGGISRQR